MKQTIEGLQVANKIVFVRVDFNVPMKDGVITDDTRIRSALPTINYLIEKGAKVILASHFGRPKGERKPEMSLAPCAKHLSDLINKPVAFVDDCIGPKVEEAVKALQSGDVLMLENLRYHNEETKNDPEFAKQLASLADVAINDAFGVSHRNAASVVGIADYIPMAAGFLLKKEIDALSAAIVHPKTPMAAIIGGAKVTDKISVISNLLPKVDVMIIGGGMANAFIKAQGCNIGSSLFEEGQEVIATDLVMEARVAGAKLLTPIDAVVADAFSNDANTKIADVDQIEDGWMILDIGPKTRELYVEALAPMKTIIWNGPMSGSILIEAFNSVLQDMELSCDVVVCPPFTAIERAVVLTKNTAIEVGAQTMDYHDAGAFTGEISPLMLTEVGVNYVIIGHSERREYYGETDETVNAKIKSAFHHNLNPIVCVGESLEHRETGHTLDWITSQLKGALADIPKEQVSQLIIAYEPIWAIGTGKTATADQAEEVCKEIRNYIQSLYDNETADAVRIQYGGSVKSENALEILGEPNIDGALVGGASLVVDEFIDIIKAANQVSA